MKYYIFFILILYCDIKLHASEENFFLKLVEEETTDLENILKDNSSCRNITQQKKQDHEMLNVLETTNNTLKTTDNQYSSIHAKFEQISKKIDGIKEVMQTNLDLAYKNNEQVEKLAQETATLSIRRK